MQGNTIDRRILAREAYFPEFTCDLALAAYSPAFTLLLDQLRSLRLTRRYRAWSTQRG